MCDYIKVRSKGELCNPHRSESINSLSIGVAPINYPPGLKTGLRCLVEGFYVVMLAQRGTGFNDPAPRASSSVHGTDTTCQLSPLYHCGWFSLWRESLEGLSCSTCSSCEESPSLAEWALCRMSIYAPARAFLKVILWLHLCLLLLPEVPPPSFCSFCHLTLIWFTPSPQILSLFSRASNNICSVVHE